MVVAMKKIVIHISDKEAASNFASLLARVREGTEVVIEHDARPVAIVRPPEALRGRLLSESVALAEAHAKELGYEPVSYTHLDVYKRQVMNQPWTRTSLPT